MSAYAKIKSNGTSLKITTESVRADFHHQDDTIHKVTLYNTSNNGFGCVELLGQSITLVNVRGCSVNRLVINEDVKLESAQNVTIVERVTKKEVVVDESSEPELSDDDEGIHLSIGSPFIVFYNAVYDHFPDLAETMLTSTFYKELIDVLGPLTPIMWTSYDRAQWAISLVSSKDIERVPTSMIDRLNEWSSIDGDMDYRTSAFIPIMVDSLDKLQEAVVLIDKDKRYANLRDLTQQKVVVPEAAPENWVLCPDGELECITKNGKPSRYYRTFMLAEKYHVEIVYNAFGVFSYISLLLILTK